MNVSSTSDAATLLQLARDSNGLDMNPASPWHVRISYEFRMDGVKVHAGTVERFYSAPEKSRTIYTSDHFNQVGVFSDHVLYRSGDVAWTPIIDLQALNELTSPLGRSYKENKDVRLEKINWKVGTAKMPCVMSRRTDRDASSEVTPKYCFDTDSVRVRYTRGWNWDETFYNNFVIFRGRYVAKDVTITKGKKASLKLHLDILEGISQNNPNFEVPQDAVTLPDRISVSSGILIDNYLLNEPNIKSVLEKGDAKIHFVVGRDGKVIEADPKDGPPKLTQALIQIIRQYQFRPFAVGNKIEEVDTEMSFHIGGLEY